MITGSKKELLNLIKRNGRISIDEATAETNLAKTTVREHFSQLEKENFVNRSFVRSGPGRPSLYFELTGKGNSQFPSSEPELMRQLLKFLKMKGKDDIIEEFFTAFWDQRAVDAQKKCDEANAERVEDKIKVLASMLEKEGFMPEYSKDGIRECHCPFADVVKETRLPCRLEKQFISKILAHDVERTSYIPDGDFCCSYQLTR